MKSACRKGSQLGIIIPNQLSVRIRNYSRKAIGMALVTIPIQKLPETLIPESAAFLVRGFVQIPIWAFAMIQIWSFCDYSDSILLERLKFKQLRWFRFMPLWSFRFKLLRWFQLKRSQWNRFKLVCFFFFYDLHSKPLSTTWSQATAVIQIQVFTMNQIQAFIMIQIQAFAMNPIQDFFFFD